jgi:hypothetical protein
VFNRILIETESGLKGKTRLQRLLKKIGKFVGATKARILVVCIVGLDLLRHYLNIEKHIDVINNLLCR